jgi:hypothetical protein
MAIKKIGHMPVQAQRGGRDAVPPTHNLAA